MNIRKAGKLLLDKVRSVDDAYSDKIADMYVDSNPLVKAAAYLVGGASPSLRKAQPQRDIGPETRGQQLGRQAMEYAVPAANAVPKYVLPAAGITLAGKALMDATALLGDQQPLTQLKGGWEGESPEDRAMIRNLQQQLIDGVIDGRQVNELIKSGQLSDRVIFLLGDIHDPGAHIEPGEDTSQLSEAWSRARKNNGVEQ